MKTNQGLQSEPVGLLLFGQSGFFAAKLHLLINATQKKSKGTKTTSRMTRINKLIKSRNYLRFDFKYAKMKKSI